MWVFFFSSRRRHTRYWRDWSSDVCSSDLAASATAGDAMGLSNALKRTRGWAALTREVERAAASGGWSAIAVDDRFLFNALRSEERRVGEEGRVRGVPHP